ncbi:MAG: tRNA-binding protein, partial [Flavobacteriales bacterium]|nr:tRNA-binding protein [Flavobacteriales bacterium]
MEELSWSEFAKVEIRTGTVVEAKVFKEARTPAYQIKIDFGSFGIKKSSAQITDYYTPESLIGKQVVAVINFPKKQIGPFMSECLVLGSVSEDGKVTLLQTERTTENGERIS